MGALMGESCDGPISMIVPAMTDHRALLDSGLVAEPRQGTTVYYRVVPEAIQAIVGVLHLSCC
jgi:hypothetical protein